MLVKLCSILILAIVICSSQGEKKWEVGDEHLKKIFGKEAFDNGKIPNHKVVYAYPREDNSRNRRQVDLNELLYTIESFDEILNLTLSLNKKLFSKSSIIQLYRRDGTLQTIDSFPKNCYYIGQVDGDPNSRVAVSLCANEMVGVVEANNGSYLVEPVSGSSHIAYEVNQSPLPKIDIIGGADDDGALPCPKLDDPENGEVTVDGYHPGSSVTYQCASGFRLIGPQVRQCLPTALWSDTTPVCVATDTAIIATGGAPALPCPVLSDPRWGNVTINYNIGINTYEAVYHCENGKSINGDKIRYCSDNTGRWSGQEPTCIPDEMLDVYINGLRQGSGSQRKKRQEEDETLSMEVMVFVDSGVVAFHGSDIIVNYIMAIMNIMASLYQDLSLRIPIDLVISRLIIEEEAETSVLNLPQDASAALNTFCQFQFSLNSEDESSSLHHDHAILITSVDICGLDSSGECNDDGVVGFAPVGGMCSFSRSCTINEDRGLGTAFVLAHETGHNLGMQHDGFQNDCIGSRRIMAPSAGGQEELFFWSTCSADYLSSFIDTGNGVCLEDPPIGGKLNASALEGLNFDADAQCRAVYGATARFCPATFAIEQLCSRLWCQPDVGEGCFTSNVPPADGTSCGEDLICVRGSCEDIDSVIIVPINGGWSSFGPYGECSRTCESGVRYRERQCNNPIPEFGGKFCEGESREYEICNIDSCPGAVDFRDVQCAETNDILFYGELLTWESFEGQFPPEVTPCQLYCQTKDGGITDVRASSVIDGTKCISHESPSAVCIQGSCIPLGCDNILNSDAREDICGVCNGNDSNATTISDSAARFIEIPGYVNVGMIPSGARDITVMETSTSAVIALQLGNTNILNGDFEFFYPGSYMIVAEDFTFVYNSSSSNGMDAAFISGPLSEQLFIRVYAFNASSYTASWEYKICGAPLPSMTSSISEPTSTVMVSTTILSTTASPSSTTSSTIIPISTAVTSLSTSSTSLTESTSVVLSTTSSSQQSTTVVHTTTSFSTTSAPVMTPIPTTDVPSSTVTPSPSVVPSSTTTRTSTTSAVSTTTTTKATPTPDPTPMDCFTYDLCGVCNGDDSSADVVTNSSSQYGAFGYYDVVTIPVGARHIMVYEDPPTTDNFIALAVNGVSILNGHFRIKSSTVFTSNGATFTYSGSLEESVTTPGPLSQPLTVQGLIGVSQGIYSLSWSYVMCGDAVAPTTSSTPTSSSLPPVTPTPEVLYPLWGFTRYGSCTLNDEGVCERSREVFCTDGLTGVRLSSDELCAARREKPSTTLRCGDSLCQWRANK